MLTNPRGCCSTVLSGGVCFDACNLFFTSARDSQLQFVCLFPGFLVFGTITFHMASAVSVSTLLKRTPHADVPTNTAHSPNGNSQKGPTILRHAHVHFYHVGSFPTTSLIDNRD